MASRGRNRKKRSIHDQNFGYPQPCKRFKSHHKKNNNYNHNIRPTRIYREELLSQSQSECDDDVTSPSQIHQLRAMSQAVYHDREEIEFEFKQCLSLYKMAPKGYQNKKRAPILHHTSSQVITGRYGNRNRNRNRNRIQQSKYKRSMFIKRSQNNPWDRKMIDFLSSIPSIIRIHGYHDDDPMLTPPLISDDDNDEGEDVALSSDWTKASLAINVCVQIYGHRVDILMESVNKLLSSIISHDNTKEKNHRNIRKQNIHNQHNINNTRRKRQKIINTITNDTNKINMDIMELSMFNDNKNKYEMDRFNIIRQETNLLLTSTQWWLVCLLCN